MIRCLFCKWNRSTRSSQPIGMFRIVLASLLVGILAGSSTHATSTIYVNNQLGRDGFDGRAPKRIDELTGPVKTLAKAMELARTGGVIIIENTSEPYYESLNLFGYRHSGYPSTQFTILGNGATLRGTKPVDKRAWKMVGKNLWRVTPWRKGHYLLLRDGEPLPEYQLTSTRFGLPKIPEGQWAACKGSVYYQANETEVPQNENYELAQRGFGISCYRIRNVLIRDLNVEHFRVDGAKLHNLCHRVTFLNVKFRENGRAGVSVSGFSDVMLRQCEIRDNRKMSLYLGNQAEVTVDDSFIDVEPTFEKGRELP